MYVCIYSTYAYCHASCASACEIQLFITSARIIHEYNGSLGRECVSYTMCNVYTLDINATSIGQSQSAKMRALKLSTSGGWFIVLNSMSLLYIYIVYVNGAHVDCVYAYISILHKVHQANWLVNVYRLYVCIGRTNHINYGYGNWIMFK